MPGERRPAEADMSKSVYDPDEDGLIALAQLVAAVCSETELAARVPSGLIILWHGTIANIPAGWIICDGNSSTPNLLAKFIEGVATAATNPGATGGATAKTTSGHQHDVPIGRKGGMLGMDHDKYGAGAALNVPDWAPSTESAQTGLTATLSESKTDGISDIRPLYYDVAFLMKT